ncbi:hypothetical protein E2C01_077907 [Portunus trituberculatus]|uniref:Uncharacterized protein n=1 Tax=Portunus trituberculatus TaxID=210409 RepID=A0A5B7ILH0_PORTR|nr:hypothetical protein [Portunus trituberculatus]
MSDWLGSAAWARALASVYQSFMDGRDSIASREKVESAASRRRSGSPPIQQEGIRLYMSGKYYSVRHPYVNRPQQKIGIRRGTTRPRQAEGQLSRSKHVVYLYLYCTTVPILHEVN